MAHEPKLEVFTFYLKSTTTRSSNAFSQFLENAYHTTGKVNYDKLYKKFFGALVKSIDNAYHKDERRKKAIGIKPQKKGESVQRSIVMHSEEMIIEGTIKGGRYGQKREIGDVEKPEAENTALDVKKIVLDDFYFLLYTPFDSHKVVLLLQSYSDDTIRDIFTSFLRKLLKADGFYKPTMSSHCPKFIQDEFRAHSLVKEFRFREHVVLPQLNKKPIDTREVTIEVKITAKNEGERIGNFAKIVKTLQRFSLKTSKTKQISLEDFGKKVGTLVNGKHTSSFELNSDFDITPSIYLAGKVDQQEDGTPEWVNLSAYCHELLENIVEEIYPENDVA